MRSQAPLSVHVKDNVVFNSSAHKLIGFEFALTAMWQRNAFRVPVPIGEAAPARLDGVESVSGDAKSEK